MGLLNPSEGSQPHLSINEHYQTNKSDQLQFRNYSFHLSIYLFINLWRGNVYFVVNYRL